MEEKKKRGRPSKPKPDIPPEPKKMGRPLKAIKREAQLPCIRLLDEELATLQKAASSSGLSFSEWVRESLLSAATQQRVEQDNDNVSLKRF